MECVYRIRKTAKETEERVNESFQQTITEGIMKPCMYLYLSELICFRMVLSSQSTNLGATPELFALQWIHVFLSFQTEYVVLESGRACASRQIFQGIRLIRDLHALKSMSGPSLKPSQLFFLAYIIIHINNLWASVL